MRARRHARARSTSATATTPARRSAATSTTSSPPRRGSASGRTGARRWRASRARLDMESVDGQREYWLHFAPLTDGGRADRGDHDRAGHHRPGARARGAPPPPRPAGGRQRARLARAARPAGRRAARRGGAGAPRHARERPHHGGRDARRTASISVRASAGEEPPRRRRALARRAPHDRAMRDAGGDAAQRDLGPRRASARPGSRPTGMRQPGRRADRLGATAFGELVACSRRRDAFSEDDLAFVESVANVLMAAVERERAVAERHGEQALAIAARGAAQRRSAARADRQLGDRLRDRRAHALGEPARDARAGLVRRHRRRLLRPRASGRSRAMMRAVVAPTRRTTDRRLPRAAARWPRAHVLVARPPGARRGREPRPGCAARSRTSPRRAAPRRRCAARRSASARASTTPRSR